MTRQNFDRELQRIEDEIMVLGSMAEEALTQSVQTLKQRDFQASRRLIAADRVINERRFALEDDVMTLIATQQPMARDMRMLAAVFEITTELERIADYAKGIARINLLIGEQPLIKPLIDLPVMAQTARDMLHGALQAFVQRDAEAARAIARRDDEVDALYNQVYRELITYVMEDPDIIEQSNFLLWAAHNLERSADRAVNICERVVFTVTGELSELDSDELGLEGLH
ncbi:MAG: phosphate signaling complex protein PhoU [Anaerolineae bacterium]|jgi:phosphate transport system protein